MFAVQVSRLQMLLSSRPGPSSHCQQERRSKIQSITDRGPAVELRAEADALLHEHHGYASLLVEPVRVAAGPLTGTQLLRRRWIETGCGEQAVIHHAHLG